LINLPHHCTSHTYTLSLHDALPISLGDDLATGGMAWVIESQLDTWLGKTLLGLVAVAMFSATLAIQASASRVMFSMARDNRLPRSEEYTSELQSRENVVCRLLLEKK